MSNEINSWDDAADWTDEATLAGASICDCLNAIRLAIIERIDSINGCLIEKTEIEDPFEPLDGIRQKVVTLLNKLELLCYYFVNTSSEDVKLKFDIGAQRGSNSNYCLFDISGTESSGAVTQTLKSKYEDREYTICLNGRTLTVGVTGKDDFVTVPVIFFNLYAAGSDFLSFCDAAGIDRSRYARTRFGRTTSYYCIDYDGCNLRSILHTIKDMYDILNLLTIPRIEYGVRVDVASSVTYARSARLFQRTRGEWFLSLSDGSGGIETTSSSQGVSAASSWEQSSWNEDTDKNSELTASAEATIDDGNGFFDVSRHACLPAVYTTVMSESYNIPLSYSYELDCAFRKTENNYLNEGHGENSRMTLLTASGDVRGTESETTVMDESSSGILGKIDAMPTPDEKNCLKYDWMIHDPKLTGTIEIDVLAPADYAFSRNEED